MKIKTDNWPDGRDWPDTLKLDVGSSMPFDVHVPGTLKQGVIYIRADLAFAAEAKRAKRAAKFFREQLELVAKDVRKTKARRLAESALIFWDEVTKEKVVVKNI